MTHKLTDRQSLITVSGSQVVNKAGEISSTVEDTSTWNGGIKDGKLALSTSQSTTVTNAENLYPALWNNSPTAWKSGSDLVVPAITDFDNAVAKFTPSFTSSSPTVDSVTSQEVECFYKNNYCTVFGFFEIDLNAVGTFTVRFPQNELPFGVLSSNVQGQGWRTSNPSDENKGHFYSISSEIRGEFPSTASGDRFFAFQFTYKAQNDLSYATPLIYLFDNVTSSSIGLPEIGAEQPGLPTLDQIAEGNRNYASGGSCEIFQRGDSFAIGSTSGDGSAYGCDRIRSSLNFISNKEANVSNEIESPIKETSNSVKVEITSSNAYNTDSFLIPFFYKLEGNEAKQLIGKNINVSFWFKSNVVGDFGCILRKNAADDTAGIKFSVDQADTWEKKSITIKLPDDLRYDTGIGEGIGVNIAAVGDYSSLTVLNADQGKWNDSSGNKIIVEGVTDWANAVGNYVQLAGFKIEQGTEATKFTRAGVTYAGELALCQRYYREQYTDGISPANNVVIANGNAIDFFTFNGMRSAPTVTIHYDTTSGNAGLVRLYGGGPGLAVLANVPSVDGNGRVNIQNDSGGSVTLYSATYGLKLDAEI